MAVKGPTGKPISDTYDSKPSNLSTSASGPGVGGGGDMKPSDKPVKGPRGTT
jgi:hypothetical protein